jgi:hypothetical protein
VRGRLAFPRRSGGDRLLVAARLRERGVRVGRAVALVDHGVIVVGQLMPSVRNMISAAPCGGEVNSSTEYAVKQACSIERIVGQATPSIRVAGWVMT